jgi:hypothetical protein
VVNDHLVIGTCGGQHYWYMSIAQACHDQVLSTESNSHVNGSSLNRPSKLSIWRALPSMPLRPRHDLYAPVVAFTC